MSELLNLGGSNPPDNPNQAENQLTPGTAEDGTLNNAGIRSITQREPPLEPSSDGGLVFITGGRPADFKSKRVMTSVRKKAMDAWLKSDEKPVKSREHSKSRFTSSTSEEEKTGRSSRNLERDNDYNSKFDTNRNTTLDPHGGYAYQETQQNNQSDRSLTSIESEHEKRKQRNRWSPAAVLERHGRYVTQLESTIKHHEQTLQNLQKSHRDAADDCLMLRYKNSLLEGILSEQGVDVLSKLRAMTGEAVSERVQSATFGRHESLTPFHGARGNSGHPSPDSTWHTSSGHRETLISLHDGWNGIPMLHSTSALLLLLSRVSRSKVEEAMAFFETLVPTCPVDARTELLISIIEHVENDLPLERWWTTLDNPSVTGSTPWSRTNHDFDEFMKVLEEKWHLEDDGSRVAEANKVYKQIKQMFYASRAKLDEALEFFETIAGACNVDKRAELLDGILQQVKKGVPPEQWWASVNDQHAERDDSGELRQVTLYKTPSKSLSKLPDKSGMDNSSLSSTATDPSELKSKKHTTNVRNEVVSSHSLPNTPSRKSIPAFLPARAHNRDSGYFSERDALTSRFATPQTLPSLTERSTISPQRWLSPWAPAEVESTTLGTASALASSHMEAIMEVDDPNEPGDTAGQHPVPQADRKLSSKYKNPDGSAMTRRKIQNMLAQKAFLARKKRIEEVNRDKKQDSEKQEDVPKTELDTTSVSVSQEVLMYQLPGEEVLIQCVCGNVNDGRFIIPCQKCGKWQHIRCYYQLAQDVVENHECIRCNPRELDGQGKVQAKRPAEGDPALIVASTATQSAKRPKTVGAESSLVPSTKSLLPGSDYSNALASRSEHQNIPSETSPVHGQSYPTSLAANLPKSKSQRRCLTCRERHLRCDEGKPVCNNCAKTQHECRWGRKLKFLDTTCESSAYLIPKGNDYFVAFQDESRTIATEYVGGRDMYPESVDEDDNHHQMHHESMQDADNRMTMTIKPATPPLEVSGVDPGELSTNLTANAESFDTVQQDGQDHINPALQEQESLQHSKQTASAQIVADSNISKGSAVGNVDEYIKQLQQQLREKDRLLEEKERQIERLHFMNLASSSTPSWERANGPDLNPVPGRIEDPGTVGTLDSGFGEIPTILDYEQYFYPNLSLGHPFASGAQGSQEDTEFDFEDMEKRMIEDMISKSALPIDPMHAAALNATTAGTSTSGVAEEEQEDALPRELPVALPDANILIDSKVELATDWTMVQEKLPEAWKWDVEYQPCHWTCTPLELTEPKYYPLTIAGAPVVLPVEHQWPPVGGVNPPPDPRPSAPLDCTASLSLEVIRDLFLTFEKSIGFYLLVNGLLQIIVPNDFDTTWASSHLPHKYGGLKVCYIPQTMEATMLPSTTETTKTKPHLTSQNTGLSSLFRHSRQSTTSLSPALKLNDFIEARPKANHRKEKYAGRIGLKVLKSGEPYLVMSTHVITEAILAKSHRETFFGRGRGRFDKLDDDWNEHIEIWAGNDRVGTIDKSFDKEAEVYPNGFHHDVALVKPTLPTSVKDIASPMSNLGWLSRDSWNSLRQRPSAVKILGSTEDHRSAKSIKCSRPSEILVVGEGIFLNQTASAGTSKSLKDHDMSTWKNLVSRALLYRVHPDFDPPNGHSGVALYADGVREDGSQGPGIVGFQSFVQRSGHVQNFNMEGPALDKRLQMGRIAFFGAFEVPEELKREYTIA